MKRALVVVESPTKAKTLERILDKTRYKVMASQGHVMDLPTSRFGVDLENGFAPTYLVLPKKRKIVKALKMEAVKHPVLYLATDPDREGEAIGAHLAALLGEGKEIHRAVFHEITHEAVQQAFQHPRQIDERKVQAQQARRVLDRILGYSLSPLLWKKVSKGLSAGRVQSVALWLVVDRERQIRSFVPKEYWQIVATLAKGKAQATLTATLETLDGKKADIRTKEEAHRLVEELRSVPFEVSRIAKRQIERNPAAPFITSTLQQAAFNRLGFGAARTMRIAQQLYEGIDLGPEGPVGLITYMRTDSVRVASEAQTQARRYIEEVFGPTFLPKVPHRFRSRKGAQEAHEAIRPTSVLRTPEAVQPFLTAEQLKLYTLIWKRFVASQMACARLELTRVELTAGRAGFRATGTQTLFPGFLKLMEEEVKQPMRDEGDAKEGEEEEEEGKRQILPELSIGERLVLCALEPSQHFTKPPARYTEASLVRTMEELGIGRPSTYAPTIQTLVSRGYIHRQGKALVPSELGEVVTDLLSRHFPRVVDVKFTAHMEEALDGVEEGNRSWVDCVREFYEPFAQDLKVATTEMQSIKQSATVTEERCPQCGRSLVIKWSRRGRFLSCSGFPECKFAKPMTTGVKCPQPNCDGELVERRSKRGIFYGCSRFPACRHIERSLPAHEKGSSIHTETEGDTRRVEGA